MLYFKYECVHTVINGFTICNKWTFIWLVREINLVLEERSVDWISHKNSVRPSCLVSEPVFLADTCQTQFYLRSSHTFEWRCLSRFWGEQELWPPRPVCRSANASVVIIWGSSHPTDPQNEQKLLRRSSWWALT